MRDQRWKQTALGPSVTAWLSYLELGGKAARTIDQYERDLALGCLLYPDLGLAEWTDEEISHVLHLVPEASRPRVRSAWVTFYRWAFRTRKVDAMPTDRLPEIKRKRKRHRAIFADREVDALIGLPYRDGALMALLLEAGIRKDEACRAQVWQIDFENGRFAVVDGKGDKDRTVPLPARALARLAELVQLDGLNSGDHLWYSVKANEHSSYVRRARPIGKASFHRWWVRCLAAADVDYRPRSATDRGRGNPHSARHTYAMRFLRGKVGLAVEQIPAREDAALGPVEALKEALGHESSATTDLYAELDAEDVAAAIARMARSAVEA